MKDKHQNDSQNRDSENVNQSSLTEGVTFYYDSQQDDRNLHLSGESGIVNHHFGIGDFPRDRPIKEFTQQEIQAILNDMEMEEMKYLVKVMGEITPEHQILDAGCGRGGTSFYLTQNFGSKIDAITISPYQKEFAENSKLGKEYADKVKFYVMNYLFLDFPDSNFDHVFTNETTHYVTDLLPLFKGFYRVLKTGGKYTIVTWCISERPNNQYIAPIDEHYGVVMHTINEYLDALSKAGFKNVVVYDATTDATPYWELRRFWQERSGIENAFYNGHKERKILYLFINAEK